MPIDISHIPKRLIDASANGDLVPFVGAGISRHSLTRTSENLFPTWVELVKELLETAIRLDYLSSKDEAEINALLERRAYPEAAQAVKDIMPEHELGALLRKRLDSKSAEPGQLHHALLKLRSTLILTTNYDLLLEQAYAKEFGVMPEVVTPKSSYRVAEALKLQQSRLNSPLIFKIHGTIDKPLDLVFGLADYQRLTYGYPQYRNILSIIFMTKIVLILGFSFSDPDLIEVIGGLRGGMHSSVPDYIVLPQGEKSGIEKKQLRQIFGLEVIEYERSKGHLELLELIEYLAEFAPPISSEGREL